MSTGRHYKFYLEQAGVRETHPVVNGLIIGRARGTILFAKDVLMSNIHAQFEIDADQVYVTDLNSSNGTFINGKRIAAETPTRLNNHDRITVGAQNLLFTAISLEQTASGFGKPNPSLKKSDWDESPAEQTQAYTSGDPSKKNK